MHSRRKFLKTLIGSAAASSGFVSPFVLAQTRRAGSQPPLDRKTLVKRHNPQVNQIDPLAPLSVGNGNFAFTADITGLQTFSREYENAMPLCTLSQWGWHTTPKTLEIEHAQLKLTPYDTYGRQVGYQTSSEGQAELFNWLRENPHRLHLGEIGLYRVEVDRYEIAPSDINQIHQELDLWRGVITSEYFLKGDPVKVTVAVHPDFDLVAGAVESTLVRSGRLGIRIRFPYGSQSMQAADWKQPDKHTTRVITQTSQRLDLERALDNDRYFVSIALSSPSEIINTRDHGFVIKTTARERLEFAVYFSADSKPAVVPTFPATIEASSRYWRRFWSTGGAIDLSASTDPQAPELERRIVLSQYLTAIQCSGKLPPQETGLTVNSWYGKFHLEMHWWHAAHFALWNRLPLFERSLAWYHKILPRARALAQSQGYAGARWPKMVGPEGRDSPSPIGPLLIWQQPHPIFYAELCYRSRPTRQTLERYADLVSESAVFMGSYAHWDEKENRYVLGPPLIPAQENHPPRETWNPTFELEYWRFGLNVAQQWRERLGMKRFAEWDRIINKLSRLPVRDGVYLAHENCPQTYTERNRDHPSMLGALGVLPGEGVDRETMRRTLMKSMKEWRWDETWGWDYPMTALTAARLGETRIAIDALLMKTEKNRYLPNGHNYQRANLPCYLPGNGGLLYAVAMMAAGWKGAPLKATPGFPDDGAWKVNWDGLNAGIAREF